MAQSVVLACSAMFFRHRAELSAGPSGFLKKMCLLCPGINAELLGGQVISRLPDVSGTPVHIGGPFWLFW